MVTSEIFFRHGRQFFRCQCHFELNSSAFAFRGSARLTTSLMPLPVDVKEEMVVDEDDEQGKGTRLDLSTRQDESGSFMALFSEQTKDDRRLVSLEGALIAWKLGNHCGKRQSQHTLYTNQLLC